MLRYTKLPILLTASTAVLLTLTACTAVDSPAAVATATPAAPHGVGTSDGLPVAEPTRGPEPTPTPMPPAAPAADLLALQAELAAAVEQYWVPGKYAVAVTDLQTGETISVNGDAPRLAGCVMNLFVIYQVARDLEAGRYDVSEADALVAATTWSSNAATARQLYALVGEGDATEGVRRVDRLISEVLELDDVLIDHPPAYHAHSIGRDYNNWLTAEDVNEALAALWRGDVVGEEWRVWVLDHLANVKAGLNYLTAAVPEGVVSHKNGFLPADTGYVDNDAGIIRLTRGDREYAYAVTFLAEEIATKYADVPLGQEVSTLTYNVMAARYP